MRASRARFRAQKRASIRWRRFSRAAHALVRARLARARSLVSRHSGALTHAHVARPHARLRSLAALAGARSVARASWPFGPSQRAPRALPGRAAPAFGRTCFGRQPVLECFARSLRSLDAPTARAWTAVARLCTPTAWPLGVWDIWGSGAPGGSWELPGGPQEVTDFWGKFSGGSAPRPPGL